MITKEEFQINGIDYVKLGVGYDDLIRAINNLGKLKEVLLFKIKKSNQEPDER